MRHHLPQVSYQIHTNSELGLMLRGEKPLAVFSDAHGGFPEVVERYLQMFDRHVELGEFHRREFVEFDQRGMPRLHVILYALPGEEWRIDEMIALRSRMWSAGWNEASEQREGELLGYTPDQMEEWMRTWRERQDAFRNR